jgi:cytochrome P450
VGGAGWVDEITLGELEADPDPVFARLRAEAPVCFVPALDMWVVTRWDDVVFVDEHPELFTAATEPSFLARALGPNMLTADPPVLTRLREDHAAAVRCRVGAAAASSPTSWRLADGFDQVDAT